MNRLPTEAFLSSALVSSSSNNSATEILGSGKFASSSENGQHVLFAPLHYEANYGYPLLVWLHGGGDSERQLRRIMPHISLRNYVAAAPRGTLQVARRCSPGTGYGWAQSAGDVADAELCIRAAIAEAQRSYNIRADRIFLAGY